MILERAQPTLVAVLPEQIVAEARAQGPKPYAFPTAFRYSDAAGCERKLALKLLGHGQDGSDFDAPAYFVTWLGSLIHDHWQRALQAVYGDAAQVEVKSRHGDLSSGSCDALVLAERDRRPWRVMGELKTMGGTKFRRAVGAPNGRQRNTAEGPSWSHVVQLALNAKAHDADEARLCYISYEAVARNRGLSEIDRFCAEWVMGREMIEAIAAEELARMQQIADDVAEGFLPARVWPSDGGGEAVEIDNPRERIYPCGYCSVRDECIAAGPGVVRIPVTLRRAS